MHKNLILKKKKGNGRKIYILSDDGNFKDIYMCIHGVYQLESNSMIIDRSLDSYSPVLTTFSNYSI
jgi:hypothetical protein